MMIILIIGLLCEIALKKKASRKHNPEEARPGIEHLASGSSREQLPQRTGSSTGNVASRTEVKPQTWSQRAAPDSSSLGKLKIITLSDGLLVKKR